MTVRSTEVAAVRRAAGIVSELADQVVDRDHFPPAIAALVVVAAQELREAAAAVVELRERAAAGAPRP